MCVQPVLDGCFSHCTFCIAASVWVGELTHVSLIDKSIHVMALFSACTPLQVIGNSALFNPQHLFDNLNYDNFVDSGL